MIDSSIVPRLQRRKRNGYVKVGANWKKKQKKNRKREERGKLKAKKGPLVWSLCNTSRRQIDQGPTNLIDTASVGLRFCLNSSVGRSIHAVAQSAPPAIFVHFPFLEKMCFRIRTKLRERFLGAPSAWKDACCELPFQGYSWGHKKTTFEQSFLKIRQIFLNTNEPLVVETTALPDTKWSMQLAMTARFTPGEHRHK